MRTSLKVPVLFSSGASGATWLLRDEFTTDAAAPLSSPRTAEPGPGTLTITDVGGNMSIAGGYLVFVGGTLNYHETKAVEALTERVAGQVFSVGVEDSAGSFRAGFYTKNVTSHPGGYIVFLAATSALVVTPNYTIALQATTVDVRVDIVLLPDAGFILFLGGEMCWIDSILSAVPSEVGVFHYDGTIKADYSRRRNLITPLESANIATVNEATAVSGTAYTATADAIHDLTATAPNPLAGSAELRYRVTDDNNYWTLYLNDSGQARLDSVAASTATNRISVNSVAAADGTRTLRAICEGTKHNVYTLSGTTWTKRGGEITVSHQNTSTTVKPVAASYTLGALRSYPRTSADYAELDRT